MAHQLIFPSKLSTLWMLWILGGAIVTGDEYWIDDHGFSNSRDEGGAYETEGCWIFFIIFVTYTIQNPEIFWDVWTLSESVG